MINMIKRCLVILVLLALLTQLVPGGLLQTSGVEAQEPAPASKISSLLALQVQAKLRAVNAGELAAASRASQEAEPFDILQSPGIRLEDLSKQQLFIHFTEEPTQSQIAELEADNVTLHLDSWLPPVGDHPTGFLIADMPIDKLETLAEKGYVVRLETAERLLEPQNDLGAQKINADDVWALGYNGTGVRIAVLDSGLDLTHADIPTPVVKKDYSGYPILDDNVTNTVTGHGTHVTSSVLGRGTRSGGVYKGSAPGADLIFLKIGNDTNAGAPTAAMVNAIKAATDNYSADIITISYGGWGTYHDGTSETAQAVDYAVSRGAVVLVAAGNSANDNEHYSGTVAASSTTGLIQVNVAGAGINDTGLDFNLVWHDGTGISNNLEMEYYNATPTLLASTNGAQSQSSRGTESELSYYNFYVPPGSSTYYLKVKNNSTNSQFFHIYVWYSWAASVTFQNADLNYTIGSPADADSAIAVGAYVSRYSWTNYKGGSPYNYGQTIDTIANFSSRGPRVDTGAPGKPNIVAPGSAIISARDNNVYPIIVSPVPPYDPGIVDNDGLNLNGSGPADYFVMQGTSMATPLAAGVAALILQKNPGWTPAQVKQALESTASDKGTAGWDSVYGWGLINTLAAIAEPPAVTTIDADNRTTTSARLSGNLTSRGSSATVNVSFQWGLSSGNYTFETTAVSMNATGAFSANLTGLTDNTTYYFRAKAVGDNTSYGLDKAFITEKAPPAVTTNAADNITATSARLNGTLTSRGSYSSANVSFDWGTTSGNLSQSTTPQTISTDNFSFSANISSLSANTTYYFKAMASSDNVTVSGSELSFSTKALVSILIAPDNLGLLPGRTQQFTATGTYSDNTTANITSTVTWSSANTSVATINTTGLATAVAAGSTTIMAALGGVSDNTTLAVTASVEVNSGERLTLTANETRSNIPLAIKGIPNSGNGTGVGGFTFNLSWNKDVIQVDNVTAANITDFSLSAGSPNNTTGTANITGNTSGSYLVGNITVANLGIRAVGSAGNSTSINVTITQLIDHNLATIPATSVNATVEIIALVAETSIAQGLSSNTTGVVVVKTNIDRIKDPADNATANIPGGIGSYYSTVSSNASSAIQFLTVHPVPPFNSPGFGFESVNASAVVFSLSWVESPIQANNTTVAEVVPILTGNTSTSVNLTLTFQVIGAASQPGLNVPEEHANTMTLLRGNVKDNDAIVDINDALFIAQYIVGQKTLGGINALNAASVRHDGAAGDIIDINDALFIAQYIVGQKNAYFQ